MQQSHGGRRQREHDLLKSLSASSNGFWGCRSENAEVDAAYAAFRNDLICDGLVALLSAFDGLQSRPGRDGKRIRFRVGLVTRTATMQDHRLTPQ